ncbi:hypothetical protein [Terricaulis sp.]|uniref:hypothetical protein n=1 Tax=Terricaulis sp. TaxID=2768686 RepID=UPI00378312CA
MAQSRPLSGFLTPDVIQQVKDALRAYGGRGALFLGNFFVSKVIAYFGPLVLAAVLSAQHYGELELALSIAMMLALFAVFGVANALPQLVLLRNPVPVKDILAILTGGASAVFLVAGAIILIFTGNLVWALACCITTLTTIQYSASAYAKTHSLRNIATWVDNFTLVTATILGVGLAAMGYGHSPTLAPMLIVFAVLAVACTAACFYIAKTTWQPHMIDRLKRAMRLGAPLIIMTIFSSWVAAAAGRTLIGFTLPIEDMALYAFLFRIASLALVIHYMISTAFYAPFYSMSARRFEQIIPFYLAFVACVCATFAIGVPLLLPYLPSNVLTPETITVGQHIFPVLALNIYGVNVSASLESRVQRVRRVTWGTLNAAIVSSLVAAAFIALAHYHLLSLRAAVWLITAQTLICTLRYMDVLARRGMYMPKVATVVCCAYAALGVLALLLGG